MNKAQFDAIRQFNADTDKICHILQTDREQVMFRVKQSLELISYGMDMRQSLPSRKPLSAVPSVTNKKHAGQKHTKSSMAGKMAMVLDAELAKGPLPFQKLLKVVKPFLKKSSNPASYLATFLSTDGGYARVARGVYGLSGAERITVETTGRPKKNLAGGVDDVHRPLMSRAALRALWRRTPVTGPQNKDMGTVICQGLLKHGDMDRKVMASRLKLGNNVLIEALRKLRKIGLVQYSDLTHQWSLKPNGKPSSTTTTPSTAASAPN